MLHIRYAARIYIFMYLFITVAAADGTLQRQFFSSTIGNEARVRALKRIYSNEILTHTIPCVDYVNFRNKRLFANNVIEILCSKCKCD